MSKASLELSSLAYVKIMLHCLKHTSSDCYGFLIGTIDKDKYNVTNAVPLSHDKLFAPSIEVAVAMIGKYEVKPNGIIGLYENLMFNQMKLDADISSQANALCQLIKTKINANPILFEVYSKDNSSNGVIKDKIQFQEFILNERGGFDSLGDHEESKQEFEKIKGYLQKDMQNDIIDFDEHLMDAKLDWRNLFIK